MSPDDITMLLFQVLGGMDPSQALRGPAQYLGPVSQVGMKVPADQTDLLAIDMEGDEPRRVPAIAGPDVIKITQAPSPAASRSLRALLASPSANIAVQTSLLGTEPWPRHTAS